MQNTPKYIKQVPWYAQNTEGKGQSINTPSFQPKAQISQWYSRGQKGFQATSFRKGACENCGALGHAKKQCTQRPRRVGAKFTSEKIAADDVIVENNQLDRESKKDRWNGFETDMYKEVIQEFQVYEEIRKKNKINEGEEDVDLELRKQQNPLQVANLPTKHAKNQKFQGLGNVRNRQDRAKYLLNLDLNGPHFDPKSRAMKGQQALYQLEVGGEKGNLQDQINFASQQQQKHNAEISSVGLPTLTQKIYKSVKQRTNMSQNNHLNEVSRKYDANSGKVLTAQLVVYEQKDDFEYNATLNPFNHSTIKSQYEENVFINDHTSVWGSWYSKVLGWGYSCCYATEKMTYCLGEKGKEKALAKELKMKAQRLREQEKLVEIEEKQEEEEINNQKENKNEENNEQRGEEKYEQNNEQKYEENIRVDINENVQNKIQEDNVEKNQDKNQENNQEKRQEQ